ncbi:DUF4307 domain-containing protein [Thermomonospora umbrina]|uniref:Uncharacterized protein DUF4307 n=1 Tax=Thermomonospora umbrina TaxID=111806 RepID=A0A3D9SWT9_9ACTN|nr:DUF4307 domain-containing protein [Thermomonospora umbrina]REE96091.1 uncharacterized protein DUF4307 [Thermomonospora umbrina]
MNDAADTSPDPGSARRNGPGWLGYVVIGLVVSVCAGGWAVIYTNAGGTPGIVPQTITFIVRDDSTVELRWKVAKPKDERVRCVVDAVDTDFAPVAEREVIVPAGRGELERTDTLRTSRRANAARVRDCHTM